MSYDEQVAIFHMFDKIAKTYDLTNRILSLGLDQGWRRKLADFLPPKQDLRLLDVACGTGDVLITLRSHCPNITQAVGVDMAHNMVAIAKEKIRRKNYSSSLEVMQADAVCLPFLDNSFDVVTIAFGIRNVVDQNQALGEFFRVLKPTGRLLVLEFSLPKHKMMRKFYKLYLRHVLPNIGAWFSKNKEAYRYLNKTVEVFPQPDEYRHRLLSKGFLMVELRPLSFGVATIYCARKS